MGSLVGIVLLYLEQPLHLELCSGVGCSLQPAICRIYQQILNYQLVYEPEHTAFLEEANKSEKGDIKTRRK